MIYLYLPKRYSHQPFRNR